MRTVHSLDDLMSKKATNMAKEAVKQNGKQESFEKTLFKAADKLRKNIDVAEYKHIGK